MIVIITTTTTILFSQVMVMMVCVCIIYCCCADGLPSHFRFRFACTYRANATNGRLSTGARNEPRNNGVIVIVLSSSRHRFYISLFRGGANDFIFIFIFFFFLTREESIKYNNIMLCSYRNTRARIRTRFDIASSGAKD